MQDDLYDQLERALRHAAAAAGQARKPHLNHAAFILGMMASIVHSRRADHARALVLLQLQAGEAELPAGPVLLEDLGVLVSMALDALVDITSAVGKGHDLVLPVLLCAEHVQRCLHARDHDKLAKTVENVLGTVGLPPQMLDVAMQLAAEPQSAN